MKSILYCEHYLLFRTIFFSYKADMEISYSLLFSFLAMYFVAAYYYHDFIMGCFKTMRHDYTERLDDLEYWLDNKILPSYEERLDVLSNEITNRK